MNTTTARQIINSLFSLIVFLLCFSQAQAIIIRHDKADSGYVVDDREFPQLFFLHTRFGNKVCVATLISEDWAITAGHCTEQTPIQETIRQGNDYPLTIAGQSYTVSELIVHPAFRHPQQRQAVDLALIRLDRAVEGVVPVALNSELNEKDQILSLIGWGYTGEGTRGLASNDGKLRRAQNSVMFAGKWLEFVFDDPRALNSPALPLEGVPGLGDSGGPALLETPEGLFLLGVALGEIDNPAENDQGRYGAVSLYERISTHYSWIMQVIAADSGI